MKQNFASGRGLRLDDSKAAQVVMDPQVRRFLEPFIGQERTMSDVAAELQVKMSSVLYRVRQFVHLGLLGQTRTEPRKGRVIRYYWSVANNFFVPFTTTSLVAQEALSPHAFGEFQRTLNESVGRVWLAVVEERQMLGVHLCRNEGGVSYQCIMPNLNFDKPNRFSGELLAPDAPAVWDTWGNLRLAREDAKALQREVASLLGRYYAKAEEAGDEYIVRLAMAPSYN